MANPSNRSSPFAKCHLLQCSIRHERGSRFPAYSHHPANHLWEPASVWCVHQPAMELDVTSLCGRAFFVESRTLSLHTRPCFGNCGIVPALARPVPRGKDLHRNRLGFLLSNLVLSLVGQHGWTGQPLLHCSNADLYRWPRVYLLAGSSPLDRCTSRYMALWDDPSVAGRLESGARLPVVYLSAAHANPSLLG